MPSDRDPTSTSPRGTYPVRGAESPEVVLLGATYRRLSCASSDEQAALQQILHCISRVFGEMVKEEQEERKEAAAEGFTEMITVVDVDALKVIQHKIRGCFRNGRSFKELVSALVNGEVDPLYADSLILTAVHLPGKGVFYIGPQTPVLFEAVSEDHWAQCPGACKAMQFVAGFC